MRALARADEAPNDGVRLLLELLRVRRATVLARRLGCDATSVRRWARARRMPSPEWRERLAVLGIPVEAWERR